MTAVLIFLSVLVPSGALGLWACANLQCCHIGFVTGSLLLGRFSLFWILLWVSYFCSVLPGQTEPRPYTAASPSRAPCVQGHERIQSTRAAWSKSHPHRQRHGPEWVPSWQGVICDAKHISLDYVHPNLVISPCRLSSRILAGFTRFGRGMTEGALVLDGI